MEITVTTSLPAAEIAALDQLRRDQGITRAEALCEAIRWYARWGDKLPVEDPDDDHIGL